MDNARLQILANYKVLAEGHIGVEEFASRPPAEREKLLWQWSTSKQMDLSEWRPYLQAHVEAK
jgi:hypothetical protein